MRREHPGVGSCPLPPTGQYVPNDTWKCPVCKQRYRLVLTPVYGYRVWTEISFSEWLLGLG